MHYHDMLWGWELPCLEERLLLTNWEAILLGDDKARFATVLIIAERNGVTERVCCANLKRPFEKWRQAYEPPSNIKQGSWEQIEWTERRIRFG